MFCVPSAQSCDKIAPANHAIDEATKITNPQPVTLRPESSDTISAARMPLPEANHLRISINVLIVLRYAAVASTSADKNPHGPPHNARRRFPFTLRELHDRPNLRDAQLHCRDRSVRYRYHGPCEQ